MDEKNLKGLGQDDIGKIILVDGNASLVAREKLGGVVLLRRVSENTIESIILSLNNQIEFIRTNSSGILEYRRKIDAVAIHNHPNDDNPNLGLQNYSNYDYNLRLYNL